MLAQDQFVERRRRDWEELLGLLPEGRSLGKLAPRDIARAMTLYRMACADLMRAQAAGYDASLIAHLDALAARGHNALYCAPGYRLGAIWELLSVGFPRAFRRHLPWFWVAAALFVLPGLVGFWGAYASRAFALGLLPEAAVEQMEEAYAEGFNQGRDEGADAMMAGFYVRNNVGIAFRCFALGILFGLGSVFFLVYNGLVIGAVAGVVSAAGHGGNLLSFISGHGAFELTAIVIAGTAGLVMGYALVDTGGRTRFASLRARAPDLGALVLGAMFMLLLAAGIEAFWSPSAVPAAIKRGVAVLFYLLVGLYLARVGRPKTSARVA